MIAKEIRYPLIDFIAQAETIPHLESIILFGSATTKSLSKKSDIDIALVFNTDHDPETGKEATIAHKIASTVSVNHDLAYPFSFVFINKNNLKDIDADFLWTLAKEGTIIWGKPKEVLTKPVHPSLQPQILIQYSTKTLSEKDKRKLMRWLYHSKNQVINKEKEKIGPGVLLVNANKFDQIKHLFDMLTVPYSVKKIWSQYTQ